MHLNAKLKTLKETFPSMISEQSLLNFRASQLIS
jgi:hypothetical protein